MIVRVLGCVFHHLVCRYIYLISISSKLNGVDFEQRATHTLLLKSTDHKNRSKKFIK